MQYYVYILQSTLTGKFYCGQTDNLESRLSRHNNQLVQSTKHGVPWILKGYVLCISRSEAMNLEKTIKKRGIKRWIDDNTDKLLIR